MTKCVSCGNKQITKVQVSDKEIRWLCEYHLKIYQNKDKPAQPYFFKASEFYNGL